MLFLPDLHHRMNVLLSQVAWIGNRVEPGFGFEVTKEPPKELGAFIARLV